MNAYDSGQVTTSSDLRAAFIFRPTRTSCAPFWGSFLQEDVYSTVKILRQVMIDCSIL